MITLTPDIAEDQMHTIARCLQELIVNKNISAALKNVVGWLANSLDIDRCYIAEYADRATANNQLISIQAGSKKSNSISARATRDLIFNTADFPEIHPLLRANSSFKVTIEDDMSPSLYDFLQVFGLKSLLLIPLFNDEKYWGYIGFADTRQPHSWRGCEAILKSLAVAIGGAIEANHSRAALQTISCNQSLFELQKEQYEFLIDSIGQATFTMDDRGNLASLSNAWQNMLGFSTEECIGKSFISFVPEEEIGPFWQHFGSLLSGATNKLNAHMQMLHKNGKKIRVLVIAKSTRDGNGNICGLFGSIENVHDKLTAELVLKQSNDKLNTILNNTREIILTVDLETNLVENINEAVSILGYSPQEWIGQSYASWGEDQRRTFSELMKLAVKGQLQVSNQQISISNKTNTETITFEFSTSIFHYQQSGYLLCVLRDIRERVAYEQSISRISDQLSHLINNIDDVYAIYDLPSQQFDFVSSNVETLYGCSKDEFLTHGITWKEVIHLEDIPGVEKSLNNIIQTKKRGEIFYRISVADGETKMLLEKIAVGKNEAGEAEKLYIVKTDYTHVENIERSLIESERKFRFISENISDFLAIHDPDWNYTYASPSVRNILGYEPEEIIGVNGFYLVHPDDREKAMDELLKPLVLEHKETQLRYRIKSHDDQYKWVETYSKVVLDHKGETSSIISSTRNVTDQVNAEQKLKTNEEQYRLLSENSNDVIAIHDLAGRFVYVSPSSLQVLGYVGDELLGKAVADVLPADSAGKKLVVESILQVTQSKQSKKYIYKAATKSGEEKWLEVVVQPVIKNDEVVALQAASRDVTEREKLLLELEQSLAKERELNELRAMFVATASHQFRTPLTIIQSGVEIMEIYIEDLPGDKQVRFQKQFTNIQTEVARLEFLMSDILLLGRADAARTPFHPETADLVAFTQNIFETKYNNRYPADRKVLLQVSGPCVPVDFDPKLLGHAIENIISNAYKYSTAGNLHVQLSFLNNEVQLAISDQGIGIPVADQKNLFQPFYRATNTSDINGTGLGLAIVKEFIDKHGGKIFLISELNKGTTVNVIIPVKQKNL